LNLNLILYGTKENPHKNIKDSTEQSTNINSNNNNNEPSLHGSITSTLFNLTNGDQRNKKAKQFLFKLSDAVSTKPLLNTSANYKFKIEKSNSIIGSKNNNNNNKIKESQISVNKNSYLGANLDSINHEIQNEDNYNSNNNKDDDEDIIENNDNDDEEDENDSDGDDDDDTDDENDNNHNREESSYKNINNKNADVNSQQMSNEITISSESISEDNQVAQGRSSLEYLSSIGSCCASKATFLEIIFYFLFLFLILA
jgi:hypothetical protein